jgi:glycosyltransferase involved in cell wall biosynthesis
VPEACITAVKDVRDLRRARRFRRDALRGPWSGLDVAFVWQHHQLFQTAGLALARTLGRPLVLSVDAPSVWEDAKLGVRRPGWGRLAEALGERRQLRAANLVHCVSEEVAGEVLKRGVPEERVVVIPNGVNLDLFRSDDSGDAVRERLGLSGKFVAGWVGSFRPFHALDTLIEAAALLKESVPDLAILLVGDGQERRRLQDLARARGLSDVIITGTVPHSDVPSFIAALDVAVLTGDADGGFHYSPIKLREYMACAKPIVAARVGEVGRMLAGGVDALVVEPGSAIAVARALELLHRDPGLRRSLGSAAREKILEGSWTAQLMRVHGALTRLPRTDL